MRNDYKIKTAFIISFLIHALLIGLVRYVSIADKPASNDTIFVEYYPKDSGRREKPPARKVQVKTQKKAFAFKKDEKAGDTVLKKPERLSKAKAKAKVVKLKDKVKKDIKKVAAVKKNARPENKKTDIKVTKRKDKPPAVKDEEVENNPDILHKSGDTASLPPAPDNPPAINDGEKGKAADKGIKIAGILPSMERLEKLSRIESEDTRGLGDTELESVRLDSIDVRYISYLDYIKLAIELAWNYPEEAARRGIFGEGLLRFTIDKKGGLAKVTLLNTTGSEILDDRFIRAIKMAAPFPPLPKNIKTKKLEIIATYRYILSIVY
jgi:TonB family protein